MKKTQKPGYLVIGSIVIGIVSILMIYVILITTGLIQVSKNHIVITTASAEKVFDGTELIADGWEVHGDLLAGHEIQAKVVGRQTEVGTSDNNIMLAIYDSQGADVTDKYEIEYQLGTLAVKGRLLSFATGSAQKYYDGEPITISSDAYQFISGELFEGHSYYASAVGQMTTIGTTPVKLSLSIVDRKGNDVTSQYSVEVLEGELTVEPRRMVVSLATNVKVSEDGADINSCGAIVSGSLLEGHTIKYRSMQNSLGNYSADTIFVWVVDERGNDVTEFYEIVTAAGDFTVQNPETFFPEVPSDLLENNKYGSLGDLIDGNPGGLDIDGDGIGDIPAELAGLAFLKCYVVNADKDGYIYLREQSYGNYDGSDWAKPSEYELEMTPYLFTTEALKNSNYLSTSVKITPLLDGFYYSMPYYYDGGVTYNYNDCYADMIAPKDETYVVSYIPFDYLTAKEIPSINYAWADSEYYDYVLDNYRQMSQSMYDALKAIADKNELNPDDPEIIAKVAEYIRGAATYNLDFGEIPSGEEGVIYFLTEGKEGVCRHFATAATLMYRTMGIPARYVTGFAVDAKAGVDTVVTGMQAHAWVEIYIDNLGWVQIEVTPGGSGGQNPGNTPEKPEEPEEPEEPKEPEEEKKKLSMLIPTSSASKLVDGKPLTSNGIDWYLIGTANNGEWKYIESENKCIYVGDDTSFEGWWFSTEGVAATGSITYVGIAANKATGIVMKDADGNSVGGDRCVLKYTGSLEIKPIEIRFTAAGGIVTDEIRYYNELESVEIITPNTSLITEYDSNGNPIRTHSFDDFTVVYEYNESNPISDEKLEFDTKNRISDVKLVIDGVNVIEKYYHVTYGDHGMLIYEE